MVRSSYIIILSGRRDDVPILGAVVMILKADGLLSYLANMVMFGSSSPQAGGFSSRPADGD